MDDNNLEWLAEPARVMRERGRPPRIVEAFGFRYPVADWALAYGISTSAVFRAVRQRRLEATLLRADKRWRARHQPPVPQLAHPQVERARSAARPTR